MSLGTPRNLMSFLSLMASAKVVCSPILLTVYIDDLLRELERQGIGCYWNKHFFGAVHYADDITAGTLTLCSSFNAQHLFIFCHFS